MTEITGLRIQTTPDNKTILTLTDRKGKGRSVLLTPRMTTIVREALAYQPGESIAEKTARLERKQAEQKLG